MMQNVRPLTLTPLVFALLIAACGGDQQAQAKAVATVPAVLKSATEATDPGSAQDVASDQAGNEATTVTDASAQDVALEQALEQAPLRPSFRPCMVASGGVTQAMQECIAKEYRHQDGRLNAVYRRLRGALPASDADALRSQQRAWLTQRDSKCAWDAATQGQAQRLAANECMLRMTAVRASELEQAASGNARASVQKQGSVAGHVGEIRADADPDSAGKLSLVLGDATVALDAGACKAHAGALKHCTGGIDLTVTTAGVARRLRVDTLYINARATAYRGPLDEPSDRAGRSIVLADLDRDGREDLALWTGMAGGYGAGSYDVYLATAKGYVRNTALSALTKGADGLFTFDNGQLVSTSKSGCCLHTTRKYTLRDGKPLLVEEVLEDSTGNRAAPKITTKRLIDGKMQAID